MVGFLKNMTSRPWPSATPTKSAPITRSGSTHGVLQLRPSADRRATAGWEWLSPDQPIHLTHSQRPQTASPVANRVRKSWTRTTPPASIGRLPRLRGLQRLPRTARRKSIRRRRRRHDGQPARDRSRGGDEKDKHVYCQKPMTHTIYESAADRRSDRAEPRGNANRRCTTRHSEDTRRLGEWIRRRRDRRSARRKQLVQPSVLAAGLDRPKDAEPVPQGLDWDLWLGPAPQRPFHRAYLPFVWRGWTDFGSGAIGDMGSTVSTQFFACLKLDAPVERRSELDRALRRDIPAGVDHPLRVPGAGRHAPGEVVWYDGGLKPPRPTSSKTTAPSRARAKTTKDCCSSATPARSFVASTAASKLIPHRKNGCASIRSRPKPFHDRRATSANGSTLARGAASSPVAILSLRACQRGDRGTVARRENRN